jgi:hypothetical protein
VPTQCVIYIATVRQGVPAGFRRLTLSCSAAHALWAVLNALGAHVTDEVVVSEKPVVPARERPKCKVKPRRDPPGRLPARETLTGL